MEGNYNHYYLKTRKARNYTLERDGRELQLTRHVGLILRDYTLERDGRELQPKDSKIMKRLHYTLERDGRELQLISRN